MVRFFAGVASFLVSFSASAQISTTLAACSELRDATVQNEVAFCSAHSGCQIALNIHTTCAPARAFLERLRTLSAGKPQPDVNDLFDAFALPVTGDSAFAAASREIRERYERQTSRGNREGKTPQGASWYYEGGLPEGRMRGVAVYFSSTGLLVRGDFEEGAAVGKAEFASLLRRDVGDARASVMSGFGIRRFSNGNRYAGQFQANFPEGAGELQFPSGAKYFGNFSKGLFSGLGTYIWTDGDRYSGNFTAGRFTGQGTLTYASGRRLVGEFNEGKLINGQEIDPVGKVVANYAKGDRSIVAAETATTPISGPSAGQVISVLGAVIGAVAQGGSAAEKFQRTLETLAQDGEAKSDSEGGGARSGETSVTLGDYGPAVENKHHCLRRVWLDGPVSKAMTAQNSSQLAEPYTYTVAAGTSKKVLTLKNTCDEVLHVIAFACYEQRASNSGNNRALGRWSEGELMAYYVQGLNLSTIWTPPGAHVWVGEERTNDNGTIKTADRHRMLVFGAWNAKALEAHRGKELDLHNLRRIHAVARAYSISMHGKAGSPLGRGRPTPEEFRRGGPPTGGCMDVNPQQIWRSTQ